MRPSVVLTFPLRTAVPFFRRRYAGAAERRASGAGDVLLEADAAAVERRPVRADGGPPASTRKGAEAEGIVVLFPADEARWLGIGDNIRHARTDQSDSSAWRPCRQAT